MYKTRLLFGIAILLGLSITGFADVSHNQDFPISGLSIQAILEPADSNVYHHIAQTGCLFKTEAIGKPELPYNAINFLIPANEEVTGITINDTIKYSLGDTFFVYPAQPPQKLDDPPPAFVPPDSEAYNSHLPYPGKLAEVVQIAYLSGYHIVTVRLYPVQWTPAIKKLTFYSKIVFTVHTKVGVNQTIPVYRRSPIVQARIEKIVRSLVENPEGLTGLKPLFQRDEKYLKELKPLVITGLPSIEGSGVDYVIITSEALKSVFQSLADWKTKKGIITQVRTIEWIGSNYTGCDLQEKIRNFIKDAYSYWGVGYVLLAGDTRIIPERIVRNPHGYTPFMPTDLYFSSLEGNWNFDGDHIFGEYSDDSVDLFPDLAVGRASVETIEEANTFVSKVFAYEKNPATDYLTKMLFLSAWDKRTFPSPWYAEQAQLQYDSLETPLGTDFPSGFSKYELYAPVVDTNPNHTTPWWEGDSFLCKDRVVNAMNDGYGLIWHVDHCSQYSFGTGRNYNSDPQRLMFRTDVANLSNAARPFILWTLGCDPNAFDYECISETFMNNPNGGAVAFMGNTVYGLFGDEWQGNWIFRSLFHYDIWNLGDAFRTVQGANNYYFGSYNQNLLGDPEMLVWDSIPKNLVVFHPDTFWLPESIFTVVVKDLAPGETAMVCVQKGIEAYAVGTVPNATSDTAISFLYKPYTPGYINVTVSCHNYFVYEDSCYVNPSSSVLLYPYSYFIFDDSVQTWGKVNGNKDGVLNPGENIQFYLDIANSSAFIGYYITAKLRSNDTLINIIDSVVYYGNIEPGQVMHKDTLTGGYFSFYLKPNYPDSLLEYHRIPLELTIYSYANRGGDGPPLHPQEFSYSLLLTEFCDSLAHSGQRVVISNDTTYLYPEISNLGGGSARKVSVILRGTGNIVDSTSYLGEIKPDTSVVGDAFIIQGIVADLQIEMKDYYGRQWIEPVAISTINPPDMVWASAGEKVLDVYWQYNYIPPNTLSGYNIYRNQDSVGPYVRLNPVLIKGVSYYHDTGLAEFTKYYYRITAVDTMGNESVFSPIASQRTFPSYQAGFPQSVQVGGGGFGFYLSSLAVADIDCDGKKEIAIGAQGRVYLFDDDGSVMPGWPVTIDSNLWMCSSPALADLCGDSTLEIVIGTGYWAGASDNKVYCFDMYGNTVPGWPVTVGTIVFASPVIADINGDGQDEILATTLGPDAGLYAFDTTGSIIPGFPFQNNFRSIPQSPSVVDIDGDGAEEMVLLTRNDVSNPVPKLWLLKYDVDSTKIDVMPGWPKLPEIDSLVWPIHTAICDVDKNGTLNFVVVSRDPACIYCYELNGMLTWEYYVPFATQIAGPGLGDINNDGYIDVIYTFGDKVFAVSGNGNLLWQKLLPISGGDWARYSQGIAVSDINNDMFPEILLSSFNCLWVLNHDGTVMEGAPFKLEGEGHSTPSVADIDNDGDIEIIGASGGDCKLKVWDLPYQSGRMEWPMFQHDVKHTGRYYTPIRGYVIINNGADTTYSRNVTLTLHAQSDSGLITEMRIWDEVNNTGWIPYDTTTTWTLITEDGIRRVYAEFRDNTGLTVKASDQIYKKCIDATVTLNEEKELTNFKLGLYESSVTGYEGIVDSIRYVENSDTTNWLEFIQDTLVKEFLPGEGKKLLGSQFKDNVGNISIIYKDSVFLDTLYPDGTIRLPVATNVPEVVCSLSASDALSGMDSCRLGNLPLNNLVPNGDFSDSAGWVCENTTIQDGYAALHGSLISAQPPVQIGAGMYQDLAPSLFQNGITYRLSAELITHRVMDVSIGLVVHFTSGMDSTILLSFLPQGNHIYTGTCPFTDTFTFDISQPLEYVRLFVSIPEIISPPWPPPETLISTTVYINNLMVTPIKPDSIYGAWIPYYEPTTVPWYLSPGDGEKIVYAQYKDRCGNLYETCDTAIFETIPPEGSIVIDKGVDTTNSSFVVLDLYAENGQSGLDKMQISNYPSYNLIDNGGLSQGSTGWDQLCYGGGIIFDLKAVELYAQPSAANGGYAEITHKIKPHYFAGKVDSLFAVSLCYKRPQVDTTVFGGISFYYHYKDGSESLAVSKNLIKTDTFSIGACTFIFQPDTTKILDYLLCKIAVHAHPCTTNTMIVDWVKLERSDLATAFTEWEPYDTLKIWQLIPEQGTRWVYAWFRDYASNVSDIASDSIVVDTTKSPLAKVEINYNDKATNYHLVNLDFTYFSLTDSLIVWDDEKISDWRDSISYIRWQLIQGIEGNRIVYAKFFNRDSSISTIWVDSIIFEQTPPYWYPPQGIVINNNDTYSNSRDVSLAFYAFDQNSSPSGVADVRIVNEWHFDNIIPDPWFDGLGYWHTDGNYAKIMCGYAEIPAIHQQSCPNGEVAFIQQEIPIDPIKSWVDNYDLDSVWWTIAMDVVANDFAGNANLWIAYHYADGYSDMVQVLNCPQTNRVYWGRRRLSGSFMWDPDTSRILDSLLIRIDIPVTYGPMPINNGSIWIDNIEIQPSSPDTIAIGWEPYVDSCSWKLLNQSGQRWVYAQFQDSAGNISCIVFDDIIYDNLPPTAYLDLPLYTNDTIVDVVVYSKDSLSYVDSAQFARFPFINFMKNSEFNSDSNWILDGQYASIHDGYADIPSVHIPGPSNPDTAFIEQFIPADSAGVVTGETLSLSLDVITDSFVGAGTAKAIYCYSDGSFDESIDRIIKIPEGDSSYVEYRRLSTTFEFNPDPSKIFTGYKIGVYIPITCESDSPPNSGRVLVDNIVLQKLPPDSLYCSQWWELSGADSLLFRVPLLPGDGIRAVYARTMDIAGNISRVCWDKTVLDTTKPQARIISPTDNSYITSRDSLPIFGTAKDARFVDYRLKYRPLGTTDWHPVVPDSYSITPVDSGLLGYWNAGALIGFYNLCLSVTDSVANTSDDSITVCFITPTETPPIVDAEFATFSSFPIDVATDVLGNVYVTDTDNDKIWKFSETGDSLLAFGHHSSGGDTTGFNKPKGIAIDDSGYIWVTDCLNHCVKKFDSLGNFKFKFGIHGKNHGEFNEPCGIAIDGAGYLWVCDNKNERVQKFDRWGNFILQAPDDRDHAQENYHDAITTLDNSDENFDGASEIKGDTLKLDKVTGISILGANVYVTDTKNDRIVVFDTAGNYVKIIGRNAGLKKPWDNQVDNCGNLFVADVYNNRIVEFSPWSYPILVFGVQGDSAGQFKLPHGIALSNDGKYLYISDTYNNRVQKFLLRFEPQQQLAGGIMAMVDKFLNCFALKQNYPNPFKEKTKISYYIGRRVSNVVLKLYDASGRVIRILVNESQPSGKYTVIWDGKDEKGRDVSSGVYFCELKAGDFRKTRKMIILK